MLKVMNPFLANVPIYFRDRLQISLLTLNEFKRINELLFPLKIYGFLMISGGKEVN